MEKKETTDELPTSEVAKRISASRPTNGGSGIYSYSNNSFYQRLSIGIEKEKIDEEIAEKLDIKTLASVSNTIRIADLGCAAGPNTFWTMHNILETLKKKCKFQNPDQLMPEFQVFFNDQCSNDFNILFSSLPDERQYFAAGVPGSFHERLFPKSSLHFVHTSYALHWLSELPEKLKNPNSTAWNKGRIHYSSAPDEVVTAYKEQFAEDMSKFLSARGEEIVKGGMMVIIMSGIPDGLPFSHIPSGIAFDYWASCLMDMSKEGLISEAQVDSFNLPLYSSCPNEMMELIERNKYFSIERMELNNPAPWLEGRPLDIPSWMNHLRAAMEKTFSQHFGNEIIDEMFERLTKKVTEDSNVINARVKEKVQLFVVLKRKDLDF